MRTNVDARNRHRGMALEGRTAIFPEFAFLPLEAKRGVGDFMQDSSIVNFDDKCQVKGNKHPPMI
ncbi:hypothetical protein M8C21_001203 [Ambrosia artemisiifolia]|uniref:Uncharacterized protein n=1 Tax=Ambrosia artemisiifolia TaxID=4212 RepID=A0AAD5GFQ0_AMBAR|nr:hypothetical protein M8C21_001203 [Ambrosia artemisiifolia]